MFFRLWGALTTHAGRTHFFINDVLWFNGEYELILDVWSSRRLLKILDTSLVNQIWDMVFVELGISGNDVNVAYSVLDEIASFANSRTAQDILP